MNKKKRKHEDCLKIVCLLCMKKTKAKHSTLINERQYALIENFVVSGLDSNDHRLPKVLCVRCRLILWKYDNGDLNEAISVFDYSRLCLKPITRMSPE